MAELWQALVGFWEFLVRDSGGVVAVFTIVLAGTTIIYVVISMKLLKQSRNAFLTDIILRVLGMGWKELKEIKKKQEGKEKEKEFIIINAQMESYGELFVEIDKKLGMHIEELLNVYADAVVKNWEKGEKELIEKEEKAKRESEKVRKQNRRNRGSETS